ncbi:MAG: hypothetical protein JNG83_06385 [Opitutaceae bacterium]|nr:hypothetical protein [Opitutaceae bacterium]
MLRSPTIGSRCLGVASRLCGQNRSPRPPAMITTYLPGMAPRSNSRRTRQRRTGHCLSLPPAHGLPAMTEESLDLDVAAAAAALKTGALLLDVREPFELAAARIEGALHIPMREIPARLPELPSDRPILVLCHHGGRSHRVTQFLRAQGFSQARNIAGGIEAWADEIDPSIPRY